jgi:hypothetical protein
VQTKLNKGAVVQIIGERDDYYKIVPPKNCFFWVALDYIKRIGPVPQAIVDSMKPETDPCTILSNPPIHISDQSLERAQLRELTELYKAEQEKPLKQRDYSAIKEKIEKFQAEAQSASVQNSAGLLLDSLSRAEMALEAFKRSLDQDERLRLTLAQIDQKVQNLVAVKNPAGKTEKDLVIEGTLAPSSVFTAPFRNRRFLVLDENEDIIYYAVAGTEGVDLTPWVGKKVSLVGRPQFDTFGKTRIIYVTGIVDLTGEKKE